MLVIKPDSSTIDAFISPPVPIYMQFYLFNVTNPDEIRFHGAKPALQEVGPYTYEEVRTKFDMEWNNTDDTVTYLQNKTFFFREELSSGLESDRVTTINALMVAIAKKVEQLPSAIQALVELVFLRFQETLFITKPVSELLFKGYEAPLLSELIKYTGDPTNSKGKFGFFYPVAAEGFGDNDDLLLRLIWTQLEAGFDLFESYVVGDMLFYGFQLPEFNFDFSDIPGFDMTEGLNGTLYEILSKLQEMGVNVQPPESLESNEIHFMKNHTSDGTYKVKTGAGGVSNYLKVMEWNGSDMLKYWRTDYCNMINGTDGTQYPPRVTKDRVLYLYTSELCRSLYLTYEKEVEFRGIQTMRFIPPKDVLEDPMVNPDNQCFCIPDMNSCLGASMLNMEQCAFGAPVILSTPHFYQGNQEDIDSIGGLYPIKNDHETFLDIEPKTGVVMRAMKKMQINIPLKQYGNLPSFRNVPEVIFPILWVNESAEIDTASAKDVKKAIYLPFTIVDAICGVLIGVGVILLCIGAYKFMGIRRSRNQHKL
ncbi:Scavenger receptor class B, member 2 [Halocaridina rubra]|uniref:Scavenger receptor class B, member 2 n=1 Tax=Halocaridina rubra TaxID=373956 RepID=A0AAN8ZSH0_HALRR